MAGPSRVPGLSAASALREAAPRLLLSRLRDVRSHLRRVKSGSQDAVHDMRVACRRLRAALRLFGQRALSAEVKPLQDALGEVRDHHLERGWLKRAGLSRLAAARAKERTRSRLALSAALVRFGERTSPLLGREARKAGGRGKLGGHRLRHQLRKRVRDLAKELRAARSLKPEPAHRARIAAKQLRYQLELCGVAAFGLGGLESLQDALGELHDADERLEMLRSFLDSASEEELPLALSALAQLCAERDELAGAARRELRRWRRKRLARQIGRAIG